MKATKTSTGRTRTILVFGADSDTKAVISSVIAHTKDHANGERVSFAGPVAFEKSVIEHIRGILVPIVDNILASLGLDKKSFEISVVNPGGVSVSDLSAKISGFSADVPVLLAMLSAAFEISIADDIIATGHVASSGGDIAAVKAMCAKISSAFEDKSTNHFIYPTLDRDKSLTALSPVERQDVESAILKTKGSLKMTAVDDITDLVQAVFTDEAMVMSSLREGFFAVDGLEISCGDPVLSAAGFLAENNETRFWNILERYFHAGDNENAKKLLLVYLEYNVRGKMYPKEFGRKLIQLLRSLPPGTRKGRIDFPVLPILECVKLTQFASELDAGDIGLLYDSAEGKTIWTESVMIMRSKTTGDKIEDGKTKGFVDSIISQIDSTNLAKTVGVPIDTARATYMLNSLTVKSNEEFHDVITGFYLHLQRHMHSVSESVDMNTVRDDAVALLERTYADKGGITAVMNEACDAIHGGMKFILDCLTEQFKNECQAKHVNRVIQEALGPLNRQAQICFISGLLQRLSSHLPSEITNAPPERFVDHYEIIVKEYVKSLDKINEIFRRF